VSSYYHWLIPTLEEVPYVPSKDTVTAIVSALAQQGWIEPSAVAEYDEVRPFCYSRFPGPALVAGAAGVASSAFADRVIRRSGCRSIAVMVTDHLLVAPTDEASTIVIACTCGLPLLPVGEPGMSRLVPDRCDRCNAPAALSLFRRLPCFRFSVVVEPLLTPATQSVMMEPAFVELLSRYTGRAFRQAGEHDL
jgi:hypothetical protein